jgi:hypothetical protein
MESEGEKIGVHNFLFELEVKENESNLYICEGRNSNLSKSRRR